jgi:hypothetical protein
MRTSILVHWLIVVLIFLTFTFNNGNLHLFLLVTQCNFGLSDPVTRVK